MANEPKDTYFVAVKVFLERDGKLFIFKDRFGAWDLPGGRIKPDEFDVALEAIVARKLSEELGPDIKYQLGKPQIFMRHERKEACEGNPTVRIFALGYPAKLLEGEPKLSGQHTQSLWVHPQSFKPEDYFAGGWLKGVEEYLEYRKGAGEF